MGRKIKRQEVKGRFGLRLKKLMDKKGIDNAHELAVELCDKKLVTVKTSDTFITAEAIRKSEIDSTVKKIRKHLVSDGINDLQGEFAMAYSTYFDCSLDYIFGLTDVMSNDRKIREAHEILGISEEAVKNVKDTISGKKAYKFEYEMGINQNEKIECINSFLSSDSFVKFIEGLCDIGIYIIGYNDKVKKLDEYLDRTYEKETIDKAFDWMNFKEEHMEEIYEGSTLESPEQLVVDAANDIDAILDKRYELQSKKEFDLKVLKYNLNKIYTNLIDELYPDEFDNCQLLYNRIVESHS